MSLKIFRVVFMICACGVMLKIAGSSIDFFRSIFIFTFGLMYDYASIFSIAKVENDTYNKWVGAGSLLAAVIFWLVSLAGLFDLIRLTKVDGVLRIIQAEDVMASIDFSYQSLVYGLFVFVFAASLEFFGGISRHVDPIQDQVPSIKEG